MPPASNRPPSLRDRLPKGKWVLPAAIGAVALLFGMGIGASGRPDPVQVAVPGPTVTSTVTATPPTITKVQEVTPAACLKYIDLSEQGFSYAGEAMGYMSDALKAASAFDVASLTAASEKIKSVTPKMNALSTPSNAAKAECKASAK
jgi:hypothetical protein